MLVTSDLFEEVHLYVRNPAVTQPKAVFLLSSTCCHCSNLCNFSTEKMIICLLIMQMSSLRLEI